MDNKRTCPHCKTEFGWEEVTKFSEDYSGFYCPECECPMISPILIREFDNSECKYCGSSLKGLIFKNKGCINQWCQDYYKRNSE